MFTNTCKKATKQIFAVMLALVMTFAMGASAYADNVAVTSSNEASAVGKIKILAMQGHVVSIGAYNSSNSSFYLTRNYSIDGVSTRVRLTASGSYLYVATYAQMDSYDMGVAFKYDTRTGDVVENYALVQFFEKNNTDNYMNGETKEFDPFFYRKDTTLAFTDGKYTWNKADTLSADEKSQMYNEGLRKGVEAFLYMAKAMWNDEPVDVGFEKYDQIGVTGETVTHFTCPKDVKYSSTDVGTIAVPNSAWGTTNIKYTYGSSDYNFDIQLVELYIGDEAEKIVYSENFLNDTAKQGQQWYLMKFFVKNYSSKALTGYKIFDNNPCYSHSGTPLLAQEVATLNNKLPGVGSVTFYSGVSGYVWYGILLETNEFPLMCFRNGKTSDNVTFLDIDPNVCAHNKSEPVIENEVKATDEAAGSYDKVVYCTICQEELTRETIKVEKLSQTISVTSKYEKIYGSKAFKVDASTDGNGTLSFTSSNSKVATVDSKGKVTIKGIGVAKITVKCSSTDEYKAATKKVITINVVPKKTSVSKLTAARGSLTVKWKKQATQTTGYQIRYSTSSRMTDAKTVTISKNSTTSKTLTGLKNFRTYYVQIRTYKTVSGKKYYSEWSEAKSLRTR